MGFERGVGRAMGLALGMSIALHGAGLGYAGWRHATPDTGVELKFPSRVEFGLTHGTETAMPPSASSKAPSAPRPRETSEDRAGENGPAVGATDAGTSPDAAADAGTRADAGEPDDGGRSPDAQRTGDAGTPGADAGRRPSVAEVETKPTDGDRDGVTAPPARVAASPGDGGVGMPPGAQIALRLAMDEIRASPLAPEIRKLLDAVPDWRALTGGSGLEPLDDLDRLMVASPDLRRSRALIAGKHRRNPEFVRKTVARMAEQRDTQVEWHQRLGHTSAPWPDRDPTERIVTMVGSQHFAITRPQDLPRLLAVGQARRERRADGGPSGDTPGGWADALLSMPSDAAVTLEVEGARQFVVGSPGHAPARVHLSMKQGDGDGVHVHVEGTYDDAAQAERARRHWDRIRAAYAGNTWLQLTGMAAPLERAQLTAEGKKLSVDTELGYDHIRLALSYVTSALEQRRRDTARSSDRAERAPSSSGDSPLDR